MASITDIGTLTDPLSTPPMGGPSGWAAAVRDALNSSDVSVDTRIANHAAAADPHPTYLQEAEADARYVELSGDTLTGPLVLAADPSVALGAATKQYVDAAMPTGLIAPFGGTVAPAGWHLCDGTAHGSAALQTVIGSANTPDLRGKFILAASATYPDKATGGAATHTLSAAESGVPSHTHPASTSGAVSANHTHSIDPPNTNTGGHSADHTHSGTTGWMDRNWSHSHSASINEGITTGDSSAYIDTADNDPNVGQVYAVTVDATDTNHLHSFGTGGASANHSHAVDIAPFTSGANSVGHTHSTSTPASTAVAATAHNNMPPYYALTYIIKK